MVFEEGEHSLFNNTLAVQAGKIICTRDPGVEVEFPTPFREEHTPVVFSQCMSMFDVDAYSLTTRQWDITNEGFHLQLYLTYDLEAQDLISVSEEVGWITFEKEYSSYPGMRYEIFATADVVTTSTYSLSFYNRYVQTPFFLPAMQKLNGRDTAIVRGSALSETGADFFIQEALNFNDSGHSPESVGYICIELYE
jgi:hypothetical protein